MESTHEATWRGGPWHGVTMDVVRGEQFFPIYGPSPRLCPVVMKPAGQWVIDWDESVSFDRRPGTHAKASRTASPGMALVLAD